MPFHCSAVVGLFCLWVPSGSTSLINIGHFASEDAVIHASNWVARHGGSDVQWRINSSRMNKACLDGVCVLYSRDCGRAAKACLYYFDGGDGVATGISIESSNKAGIEDAVESLGFIRHEPNGSQRIFPFALFSQETRYPGGGVLCHSHFDWQDNKWISEKGCPQVERGSP